MNENNAPGVRMMTGTFSAVPLAPPPRPKARMGWVEIGVGLVSALAVAISFLLLSGYDVWALASFPWEWAGPWYVSWWELENEENFADWMRLAEVMTPLLAIIGGGLLLRRTKIADRQADLVERGQVTDRFTKAVEQLGNEKRVVRLGAIYSLERIAKDSRDDRGTITEVLCAFVRDWGTDGVAVRATADNESKDGDLDDPKQVRFGGQGPLPTDVQAAIAVLATAAERGSGVQEFFRDLSGVDFNGRNLSGKTLSGLWLQGANLSRMDLTHSNLNGADLSGSNLSEVCLAFAKLGGANLVKVNLSGAILFCANLDGATLNGCNLSGAKLEGAMLLGAEMINANLTEAMLCRACLRGTELHSANFDGADVTGADLSGALNLTPEQLAVACGDETTILPDGIDRPDSWAGVSINSSSQ